MTGRNKRISQLLCSLEGVEETPTQQLRTLVSQMGTDDLFDLAKKISDKISQNNYALSVNPAGANTYNGAIALYSANLQVINDEIQGRPPEESPSVFSPPPSGGDIAYQLGSFFSSALKHPVRSFFAYNPFTAGGYALVGSAKGRQQAYGLSAKRAEQAETVAKVGREAMVAIPLSIVAPPVGAGFASATIPMTIENAAKTKAQQVAPAAGQAGSIVGAGVRSLTTPRVTPIPPAVSAVTGGLQLGDDVQAPSSGLLPSSWGDILNKESEGTWTGRFNDFAYIVTKKDGKMTVAKYSTAQIPSAGGLGNGELVKAPSRLAHVTGLSPDRGNSNSPLDYSQGMAKQGGSAQQALNDLAEVDSDAATSGVFFGVVAFLILAMASNGGKRS